MIRNTLHKKKNSGAHLDTMFYVFAGPIKLIYLLKAAQTKKIQT